MAHASEATHPVLAIVTGASSGIGAATAERLALTNRFRLLLAGRDAERLAGTVSRCRQAGADVQVYCGDLADPAQLDRLLDKASECAPVGVLVNNAGLGSFGAVGSFEIEAWEQIISVNLTAAFVLSRGVVPLFKDSGVGGTIVNISSDADSVGFSGAAAYCASKGGLLAMTRALREELRPDGIRVCSISPGRVDTCFNAKQPGMRPGALSADEVAEVVAFAVCCSPNIELHEIRLDSMGREYQS